MRGADPERKKEKRNPKTDGPLVISVLSAVRYVTRYEMRQHPGAEDPSPERGETRARE